MSETKKCLFCDENAKYECIGDCYEFSCPNCGDYKVSGTLEARAENYSENKHLISGLIREKNDLGLELEMIKTSNIDSLINNPMIPTQFQKHDKILLHYYRETKRFGQKFRCEISATEYTPHSIGYCTDYKEFYDMIVELGEKGLFHVNIYFGLTAEFSLTSKGMEKAEELGKKLEKHSDYSGFTRKV